MYGKFASGSRVCQTLHTFADRRDEGIWKCSPEISLWNTTFTLLPARPYMLKSI